MTKLEIVYLNKNGKIKRILVQSDATTLYLKEMSQIDLSFVSRLPNLKDLRLLGSLESVDLTPLRHCLQLERLVLASNRFKGIDLSPLIRCPNLREVHIDGNNLPKIDLRPLAQCSNLGHLDIRGNELTKIDLRPLAQCSNLRYLDIRGNKLVSVDLSHLAQCQKLQYLNITENPLPTVKIGALSELLYLRVVANSTTTVQHGGDWWSWSSGQPGNNLAWATKKNKPMKKEAVPVPKRKKKPARKAPVSTPASPLLSSELSTSIGLRVWWDYENMGVKFEELGKFTRALASYSEIQYGFVAAQWTRLRGQERVLGGLGFLTLACESEENDAADKVLQKTMEQTEVRESLIEVVITHDAGFNVKMKEFRKKGAKVWLVSNKKPPSILLEAADWYSTMNDIMEMAPPEGRTGAVDFSGTNGGPMIKEKKVVAKRGYNVVGGELLKYKVKVVNDTDETITNVIALITAHPRDCLRLVGNNPRTASALEPRGGARAFEFEFVPTQDCVRGEIHCIVTYHDYEYEQQTVSVENRNIELVCDLLQPLKATVGELTLMLQNMVEDRREFDLQRNPRNLFASLRSAISKLHYYIVESKEELKGKQFIGTIRCLGAGKFTEKRLAPEIVVRGPVDGQRSSVIINASGEDVAMLSPAINEIKAAIEELKGTGYQILQDVEALMQVAEESDEAIQKVQMSIESVDEKMESLSKYRDEIIHLASVRLTEIGSGQRTLDNALEDLSKRIERISIKMGVDAPFSRKLKDAAKKAAAEGAKIGAGNALWLFVKVGLNLLGFPLP